MLKVLKFGGTSVGTIQSLKNVKQIVESLDEPAVVVVSALGGLTDRLIATANQAASGVYSEETMAEIRKRHYDIIDELVAAPQHEEVTKKVTALLDQLADRYRGVSLIKQLPISILDEIVSYGERMSSVIVAGMLEGAEHHDSTQFVKTEKWFNKNIADRKLTDNLIREEFPLPLKRHAVAGGFISTDKDSGEITNLGRGGSDYSAALVAAALNADVLEIWTDVDGFLTADPRIITGTRIIPTMSFVESMELCSYGAKVIYPPTIYPVFHKNIPIKILNTFNPTAPGTHISDGVAERGTVRGVSSLNNTAVIRITGPLTGNVAEINSRAYNAMARNGISVFLVSPPSSETSFSIAMPESDLSKALEQLKIEFSPELSNGSLEAINGEGGLSVVAIVGEGIKQMRGLTGRLVNTLQRAGIEVKGVSEGTSDTTIAIMIPGENVKEGMNLIHSACFDV